MSFIESAKEIIRFRIYLPLLKFKVYLRDYYYGIDTGRMASLSSLGLPEVTGSGYEQTSINEFNKMMRLLKIESNNVFLDFGCGEGGGIIISVSLSI